MSSIELKEISKIYGKPPITVSALKNISIAIKAGEFVGLAGASGSGKTSLLNIVGLSDTPSSGEILIEGRAVPADEDRRTSIRRTRFGYVFQLFNLVPTLNASENVALMAMLNGASNREALHSARELLAELGMGDRTANFPHQLSGGEMQRVALCRAIIHKPGIVIADEPTGSLDSVTGELVVEKLAQIAKNGVIVIMASHNEEALKRCTRVIRLRFGEIQ